MRTRAVAAALCASALAWACGPTVMKPRLYQASSPPRPGRKPQPLKVHLTSGELIVLDSWTFSPDQSALSGQGTRYSVLREPLDSGPQHVATAGIALLETNDRETVSSLAVGGLSTLTVLYGAASIACLADPKSCFGSCPTFYLDGDNERPRAEGFSASVARALESSDVDALEGAHPVAGRLSIHMRNEAQETHAVRRVRVLSVARPPGARVFADASGRFHLVRRPAAPTACAGPEGDCRARITRDDGIERQSLTDPDDLAAREEVVLAFENAPARGALVIRARQSLLSTFLFYQTLAYMGRQAGDFLASVETGGTERAHELLGMSRVLGGIEVEVAEAEGEWSRAGAFDEAGPIAGDTQVIPLPGRVAGGSARIRLRMAKGHWRIDSVALAELGPVMEANAFDAVSVERAGGPLPLALRALRGEGPHLITLPGDDYRLTFALPAAAAEGELFLESRGYYYEWMRDEWLSEEDPAMVAMIVTRPEEALRRLARPFKAHEAGAEQAFWASRFGR